MNTYLFSIHPKWCEKIFSGEKTIEVRKTAPKPPFKVVVYCTKGEKLYLDYEGMIKWSGGYHINENNSADNYNDQLLNGKVIGEFICEKVVRSCGWRLRGKTGFCAKRTEAEKLLPEKSCLSIDQIVSYAGGECRVICGLNITAPKLYDEPKELGEFRKPCGNCIGKCTGEHYDRCPWQTITRPPQSYMRIQDPKEM